VFGRRSQTRSRAANSVKPAFTLRRDGRVELLGYHDHLVKVKTGLLFGIPSVLAIFITRRWIVPSIPEVIFQTESLLLTKRLLIMGVFSVIMILASLSMIRGRREIRNLTGGLHYTWGKALSYSGGDTGSGFSGDTISTIQDSSIGEPIADHQLVMQPIASTPNIITTCLVWMGSISPS